MIDLELARRHMESLRSYRVPNEPVGTIEVLDWLTAEVARRTDELAAARAAIAPVLDWYQSDESEPRTLAEILTDLVGDLQSDRADSLQLAAARAKLADYAAYFERWPSVAAVCELLAASKELIALMDDVPPDPMPGLSYEQNDRVYARYEFERLRAAVAAAAKAGSPQCSATPDP